VTRFLPIRLAAAILLGSLIPATSVVLEPAAYAQSANGVVTGVVADATGAMIPGADVTLTSPSQGTKVTVKTNESGIYRFGGVNVGAYVVSVMAPGFSKAESPVNVTVGGTAGRDFALVTGSTETTVEVSTDSMQLQTEDAVRGGQIETKQLIDLPISGQNSLNLILTVPGVVRSNLSSGGSTDSGIGAVNGARARSNSFLLDGILNNDISVNGPQYTITNNDELAVVSFQTTNFSPEFGRAGGAVVSQVTRSGTNAIHGSLAYVYRSQLFDASTQTQRNAYASNLATYQTAVLTNPNYPVPALKNKYHENIPAFTIGGPVVLPHLYNGRDRTFFFAGGQWDRYSSNALTTFSSVPTDSAYATLKALAATGTCPNVQNYLNLLSAAGNPTGSSTGVGVSTLSIAVPASLAATTCNKSARTGQTLQVGQYYRTAKDVSLDNNHLIRIDHRASNKQGMMFRWLYDNLTDNLGGTVGHGPQFDVPYAGRTLAAAFSDTYQFTNAVVNEFRFGFTRANFQFNPAANAIGATIPQTTVTSRGQQLPV
jgi:Carboxypeptidase regulatory-like domain